MSRKLYLTDAQVAAGQAALAPLKATANPDLLGFIEHIEALRSKAPKDWQYRVVDEAGNVPDLSYNSTIWDTERVHHPPHQPYDRKLDSINGVYVGNGFHRSIAERKRTADRLTKALGRVHHVERRECITQPTNYNTNDGVYGPWQRFYTGKAEKA